MTYISGLQWNTEISIPGQPGQSIIKPTNNSGMASDIHYPNGDGEHRETEKSLS